MLRLRRRGWVWSRLMREGHRMLEITILSEHETSVIFSEVCVWERYVYPGHILEKRGISSRAEPGLTCAPDMTRFNQQYNSSCDQINGRTTIGVRQNLYDARGLGRR